MYRIDNNTAVAALAAPTADGPNPGGYYTSGNPGTGVPATVVPAEHLNMLQEEIAHVIEDADAGNTPLNKAVRTQLKAAIAAMIAAAVPSDTTPTGFMQPALLSTAPAGWLLLNGDTIGSDASGATQASDSYEALFIALWNSLADAEAPVSGGRGASAQADWDADKTLTLPDARGRAVIGAGTGAGLTARTLGGTLGEEEHTLTEAELAAHTHVQRYLNVTGDESASPGNPDHRFTSTNTDGDPTGSTGGDNPHNNMQPSLAANWMVKI